MNVYLDNAATTPVDPEVAERMYEVLKTEYGNPSSIHGTGRKAKNILEQSRKKIAASIGAAPGEIIFTSGGTEANNMALKCAVRDHGVRRIITTKMEHHSVLHAVDRLQTEGVEVVHLSADKVGSIHPAHVEEILSESQVPTLISIMYANNEIGTVYPIEEIGQLARKYKALFHCDTVQAVGHFPLELSSMPIDFVSGAAHKFHGPKGVGFLYIHPDIQVKPIIDGGAQERNLRAGTENIAGIAGMAHALELAIGKMDERKQKILLLRDRLKSRLVDAVDGIEFNGPQEEPFLYTVLSASFPPGLVSDLLLLQLDMKGICVSSGSACSSGAEQGSHVIRCLRGDDNWVTIRFSFSHLNTPEEIDYTADQLAMLIPGQAEASP